MAKHASRAIEICQLEWKVACLASVFQPCSILFEQFLLWNKGFLNEHNDPAN